MNIQGKNLWQHAAGDGDNNHVKLCLKWSVILNGPGGEGEWNGGAHYSYLGRKQTDLRRFCEEMKNGDIVVLRMGTKEIYGVGVVGEYKWCDEFNDVDGWNLGHTRRVCWLWRYDVNGKGSPKYFNTYTMKLGDTTQRLDASCAVIPWLESLVIPQTSHSLSNLPGKSTEVSSDEIAAYLFNKGIASDSIRSLLDQNGEFIRMANWYNNSWKWGTSPSEHETVCHLVVPLLRILGWTPQRMALEWSKIDIALFSRMPREDDHLSVVVEVKKVGDACLSWAVSQAENYASKYPNCRRLVVTDGLRYGIFTRDENKKISLYAYLNLIRFRNKYSIYECKGAREAILAMTPEWYGKLSQ